MVAQAVVDVEEEIEGVARDLVEIRGAEVLGFDERRKAAQAVNAGGFGSGLVVEDNCDAGDGHGGSPFNERD